MGSQLKFLLVREAQERSASLLLTGSFFVNSKPRHLDRSNGQFHRPLRSGETPAFVFAFAFFRIPIN
jgi:hypothetical protein